VGGGDIRAPMIAETMIGNAARPGQPSNMPPTVQPPTRTRYGQRSSAAGGARPGAQPGGPPGGMAKEGPGSVASTRIRTDASRPFHIDNHMAPAEWTTSQRLTEECNRGVEVACEEKSREDEAKAAWLAQANAPPGGQQQPPAAAATAMQAPPAAAPAMQQPPQAMSQRDQRVESWKAAGFVVKDGKQLYPSSGNVQTWSAGGNQYDNQWMED
jgi:hypothetical protein